MFTRLYRRVYKGEKIGKAREIKREKVEENEPLSHIPICDSWSDAKIAESCPAAIAVGTTIPMPLCSKYVNLLYSNDSVRPWGGPRVKVDRERETSETVDQRYVFQSQILALTLSFHFSTHSPCHRTIISSSCPPPSRLFFSLEFSGLPSIHIFLETKLLTR